MNTYPTVKSEVRLKNSSALCSWVVTNVHEATDVRATRYDVEPVFSNDEDKQLCRASDTKLEIRPHTVTLNELESWNDWRPEVRTLLHQLKLAGFSLRQIDNGDDENVIKLAKGAQPSDSDIEEIVACDDCRIAVSSPEFFSLRNMGKLKLFWLYLVFGNSPGELVADYHCNDKLDTAINAASRIWEGKKVPQNYTN